MKVVGANPTAATNCVLYGVKTGLKNSIVGQVRRRRLEVVVGIAANGGKGDSLREAFTKVNERFAHLEAQIDRLEKLCTAK